MSIPFNVLYNSDKNGVASVLPSDGRNINIIKGVNFGKILGYIQSNDMNSIESWVEGYENILSEYLHKKEKSWKKITDLDKYCTNLNYIIDFIVQGLYNLNEIDKIRWTNRVEYISMDTLLKYPLLKCRRNLKNYENKDLFFKKLMLDLCEDIAHIKNRKKIIKDKKCPLILSRLQYRKKTLMDHFHSYYHKSRFYQDSQCSIDFIHRNLSDIRCNKIREKPNITGASEGSKVIAPPSAERAKQHAEEASETEVLQDPGHDDSDNPELVDPFPENLKFSLPVNDDPPKLDTTYAAASLAGISLFGTILYKVKYHCINEILCTSFIFHVNIILI
ncbi:hypothetical protein PVBG_05428 [Plasmodium vivax Brazil I]|uniref:Uncharacterized protein n=1 Tax=Plasmodium vivax (strain Brazil I) TaxID=1033975 RepID=A0A0J9SZB9_PLAV1|nr:hypothetical protein PVBG_05428 [Plasmodium vivax Brazil I]